MLEKCASRHFLAQRGLVLLNKLSKKWMNRAFCNRANRALFNGQEAFKTPIFKHRHDIPKTGAMQKV